MNKIRKFESIIGGRWTGIIFHQDTDTGNNLAEHPVKFCEAIKKSSTGPLVLTQGLVNCPGALRSFGWETNNDEQLATKISLNNGIKKQNAEAIIKEVPQINDRIKAITVGSYESPDVIISYCQPEAAMRFVYQWQKISGKALDVSISSVMAVCGGIAAGAFLSGNICLSFGCPESRNYGAIGNDRLIIGVPAQVLDNFF